MDKTLEFMVDLAKRAGDFAKGKQNSSEAHKIDTKATEKDIVTAVDKMTEELILKELKAAYPGYSILAEESGTSETDSDYLWVVDPIDGTTNFAAGIPLYSISIGLYKNGKPYAGAVYMPALVEMYCGMSGEGAYLNGTRMHVSKNASLIKAIGATGFGCLRANLKRNNLATFCDFAPQLRGVRRSGSAALDLCFVAAGRYDFFWEYPLSPYDVGAGAIIVREAGGTVTDFDGNEDFPQSGIVASNGLLHEIVRERILKNDYRA